MFDAQFFGQLVGGKKRSRIRYWIAFQLSIKQFQIERQILDTAFTKFYVRVGEAFGNDRRVASRHLQHFVRHINANHFPVWPDDLRSDKTDFSRATAEIENRFAFAQITRRIAAAVIALDHFLWNDAEICRLIINRTTKFLRALFCSRRITLADDAFLASTFDHLDTKL